MKRRALVFAGLLMGALPGMVSAQTNANPADAAPAPATAGSTIPAAPTEPTFNPAQPPAPANAPEEKLDDIRPPMFPPSPWFWILTALATLGVLALLAALWKWLPKRRTLDARSAYELALEELEKARELMRAEEPAPYAVAVSETVRGYLGQRFHTPSTRRTTEEFLRQMQRDSATPLAAHRDLLGAFLQACDLVKFARYRPTLGELEQVQERAVSFVKATKPEPAAAGTNGHRP